MIGTQSAAALGNFLLPTASAEDTLADSVEAITTFSELTGQFENQTQGHLCKGLIERARCFLQRGKWKYPQSVDLCEHSQGQGKEHLHGCHRMEELSAI